MDGGRTNEYMDEVMMEREGDGVGREIDGK